MIRQRKNFAKLFLLSSQRKILPDSISLHLIVIVVLVAHATSKNIIRTYFWRVLVLFNLRTFDSKTHLCFRRPKIASWFADFPYCGRALYCTLCVSGNALNEVMTPRETMAVTHTFPRFRIAIFHLVSHALPLAHRSVNCDVLSPTSSSPLSFLPRF